MINLDLIIGCLLWGGIVICGLIDYVGRLILLIKGKVKDIRYFFNKYVYDVGIYYVYINV